MASFRRIPASSRRIRAEFGPIGRNQAIFCRIPVNIGGSRAEFGPSRRTVDRMRPMFGQIRTGNDQIWPIVAKLGLTSSSFDGNRRNPSPEPNQWSRRNPSLAKFGSNSAKLRPSSTNFGQSRDQPNMAPNRPTFARVRPDLFWNRPMLTLCGQSVIESVQSQPDLAQVDQDYTERFRSILA